LEFKLRTLSRELLAAFFGGLEFPPSVLDCCQIASAAMTAPSNASSELISPAASFHALQSRTRSNPANEH
jgi:hypothetical protein